MTGARDTTQLCFSSILVGIVVNKEGTLGGSKNRKTATKCAKNCIETVSKIIENQNRNVYVAL